MRDKVLLLEFNELTPRLMEQFIDRGLLPNFRRLRDESHAFITDANEKQEHLEPWIQWVTVHTGLSFAEHGVYLLNEGQKLQYPSLWDLASRAGRSVWVCGSMNAKYDDGINGWVLPDPWTESGAYPKELNRFYDFVRSQVQEHSNEHKGLSASDAADFLAFLATHGLSTSTIAALSAQLLNERFSDSRWKRAVLLDRMQWDLFKWRFRRAKPDFSTFFLNSTAHFQHVYWRNFEPEQFELKPSEEDRKRTGDSIPFGYQQMDRIVGEALDLAGDDTVVILATALSQQPYLRMESTGGKILNRPIDVHEFPRLMGLKGNHRVVPVMAEQFHIYFDQEQDAIAAQAFLSEIKVGDRKVFGNPERHGNEVFVGCMLFEELPADTRFTTPSGADMRFYDVFYVVKDSLKSGMHHPDGLLWIRGLDRAHSRGERKVPLTAVAPTVLRLMGLDVPGFMKTPAAQLPELRQPVAAR